MNIEELIENNERIDPSIRSNVILESKRQETTIELIASENYPSNEVRLLAGSCLNNKYAEGYPGKRYYGGCAYIDNVERAAIEYVCKLYNSKYANVQPHSGSSANMGAYRAILNYGDRVLGMSLNSGGHLTHSSKVSFIGKDYEVYTYGVDNNGYIDYEEVKNLALNVRPKLIIAGASAYSRKIDFKKFREIADASGAYLLVDMAHIAGLVAAGYHESPVPYADIVTSTTHKTLRGIRGGFILTNRSDLIKKINSSVFPGIQGGPLEHIIAAKAQTFYEALQPEYRDYIKQVLLNMKAFIERGKELGMLFVSGGSDNHLVLLDVYNTYGLTGKEAEYLLDRSGITVNKNMIPGDIFTPAQTSGIRVGTAAMTTKGYKEEDFKRVADKMNLVLRKHI